MKFFKDNYIENKRFESSPPHQGQPSTGYQSNQLFKQKTVHSTWEKVWQLHDHRGRHCQQKKAYVCRWDEKQSSTGNQSNSLQN